MKILFLSCGEGEDYQCDALFDGLRELLGPDAIDVNKLRSLYAQSEDAKSKMYGLGYTLYANVADINVDRSEIESKIRARFFDLVIFGSIQRWDRYLDLVLASYPPNCVAFVDGEDDTRVRWQLLGKGVYFKRELQAAAVPFMRPIYFAVPAAKFVSDETFDVGLKQKSVVFAPCDPRDRATYVFRTEASYYRQYQTAYFGYTMKKAGWDCMRHHEIVAQGTAPYFLGLEACPDATLHLLPRSILLNLRELADEDPAMASVAVRDRYGQLLRELFSYYKLNFTTAALARYVLKSMSDSAQVGHGPMPFSLKPIQYFQNVRRNTRVAIRKIRDGSVFAKAPGTK